MTNEIIGLIANDRLEEAAKLFERVVNNSPRLYEALQQRGRLSNLDKIFSLGSISPDQYLNEKNRIRIALLDLVRELEEAQSANKEIAKDIEKFASKNAAIIQTHSGSGHNVGGDFIAGNKFTK